MRVLLAVLIALALALALGAAFLIVSRDGGGGSEPAPADNEAASGAPAQGTAGRAPADATPGAPKATDAPTAATAPATPAGERDRLLSLIEGSDLDPAQKATLRDALEEVEERPELLEPLARRLSEELGG
jgi:hypothetical protein